MISPYRCETCNNIECFYHPSKKDINQYGVNNSAWAHSKYYGCASHSDFKRADSGDMFINAINKSGVPNNHKVSIAFIRRAFKEIHKQEK